MMNSMLAVICFALCAAVVLLYKLHVEVDALIRVMQVRRSHDVGELTMTLTCDTSQFDERVDAAMKKLDELKAKGVV